MNEVIRQLHERKSVRAFEDRPIDSAIKREILPVATFRTSCTKTPTAK